MTHGGSESSRSFDQAVQALLRQAQTGDHEALGDLLEQFRDQLRELASDLLAPDLKQKVAASDLVQETCIDAMSAFDGAVISHADGLKNWLVTLLTHNVVDWQRKFKRSEKRDLRRERALDDDDARDSLLRATLRQQHSPSSGASDREEQSQLEQALERLPRGYRQIIVWRNQDRLTWVKIGRLVDRSPDAARMFWRRAIARLKRELRKSL